MNLFSETTKTCADCQHWGAFNKRRDSRVGCKIMLKWYNPCSSACFLADMTTDQALTLGTNNKVLLLEV